MKPNKDLQELLKSVRDSVVQAYQLLQTQNATDLSKVMAELGMINFSISYYVAEYEFESQSLNAEYKRQLAVTFMENRRAGATEKNSEAVAKMKWHDMLKQYLDANKAYRLAKSTHSDVDTLCDIMRSRISLLKQEMYTDGKKDV